MVSVANGQGRVQGVGRGVCILPLAIFKNVFDIYNFSVISNLFENNKPYALGTHNEKCANKMHHIWRSTQIKKFEQDLPENYLKSTKIAITACKFSGRACPRTPQELFLFFYKLQICSAEEKYA